MSLIVEQTVIGITRGRVIIRVRKKFQSDFSCTKDIARGGFKEKSWRNILV